MFDKHLRPYIDPPLNRAGAALARLGITADAITALGLLLGLAAAVSISVSWMALALVLILLSRIADGLDGAVARATRKTDFGGYFDILADFLFYGAVPLGFILADPARNGVAGGFLLLSFYVNGASFLGYAVLAERHGEETEERGSKSLYFTGGLLEGTETIAFFVLLCLMPAYFPLLAILFGIGCFITAGARLMLARQRFSDTGPESGLDR
ncbi:CDP-alcohol phosphatidyltransferase family protein [Cucumibacter marinus]|uniref:CDP-alcohol phosphatidyltransferase family protein n=1 Tax=Cucumibacter marinus TaxID=1121252 RepID=UPI00041D1321|nr:CDP-alcohol phosphatidyltransferase family protein [Cucumibacter marinus]